MKWLIVNADDLGISERRNQGILEAHRKGIVTSASLLAYGPAYTGALKLVRATPSLDVGLHFNLSEGEPLVLGHKTLVAPGGKFWGKEESRRRAKDGLFDPREVEREAEAQIDLLKQARLNVSHINGHQHIHIYGALPEAISRAASRLGVRCFRCPVDTMVGPVVMDPERMTQVEEYRRHALRAADVYGRVKMRSTEHFGGIALSHHMTLENFIAVIKDLPAGLSEIMVHPGYADAKDGFPGPDRERELRTLTDPRLKILLQQQQVQLTAWSKL